MKGESLFSGFARSVGRFPGRPALDVQGEVYTYEELGTQAALLGAAVQEGADSSPLIGVFAYRSLTAYAGILGVLAAGRGYVPLHPAHPPLRTRRIISLADLELIVVGEECLPVLEEVLEGVPRSLVVLCPDVGDLGRLRTRHPAHRWISVRELPGESASLESHIASDDLAYLLFTSGSTGMPKGVPITHRNARAFIQTLAERYDVNEYDRFTQLFDLTFDFSVYDLFVCWERGACLCCPPREALMAPARFVREKELTMWASVPSTALYMQKLRLVRPGLFPSLRCSIFGGEPLPASLAESWQEATPAGVVENVYGPTETACIIAAYRWEPSLSPVHCRNGIVPFGRIFEDQDYAIVGENLKPVAFGEPGELCLAGTQVTPGYWKDPDRNATQFIRIDGQGDRRWYRTGDRVLEDEEGLLHPLGRLDFQVKIRGHRVELQEVEQVLRQALRSEWVVALAWPVNEGHAEGIVAFVEGESGDGAALMASCRTYLPAYMVPQAVHFLLAMPRNENGKVDRKALVNYLNELDGTISERAGA